MISSIAPSPLCNTRVWQLQAPGAFSIDDSAGFHPNRSIEGSFVFREGADMEITLDRQQIEKLAAEYNYGVDDRSLCERFPKALQRGRLTRDELVEAATWKWPGGRVRKLAKLNSEDEVEEATRVSFSAVGERLRIGALMSLQGVNWPMASVILHFAYGNREANAGYPIFDRRAMKAVGGSVPCTYDKWLEYTRLCREAATRHEVSMRVLDKALWQAGG